jgi:hypothetical protein
MKPNVQWEASCTSPLSTALLVFFANEKSPKISVLKKMQLEKKKFWKTCWKIHCQLPIPNSYPDASSISLDGSGSYVFFYIFI